MKKLRVILIADVQGVGKHGDVVDVAPGFAENGLFPKGQAVVATPQAQQQAQNMTKLQIRAAEKMKIEEQQLFNRLSTLHLKFTMRANEHGSLYASIKPADIVQACVSSGLRGITERSVRIPEQINRLGNFTCEIRVGMAKPALVPVSVVARC